MIEYFNAHPGRRGALVFVVTLAMIMQTLDMTIANVALPHMQSSMGAAQDQISWVVTSYVVASAICMSLTGYLASRFGAKAIFVASIVGFTAASLLCGIAQSLPEMIAYRMMQGAFGAGLLPLSQSIMMDVFPREKYGPAMAIWGMGVMLGPILGPSLGGYLTEYHHWRWIFFINLPLGIICTFSVLALLPKTPTDRETRFDFLGFGLLAVALGAFQLMLDRGQTLDWFTSTEIWIEAVVAALAFYAFVVHIMTAKAPFISPAMFKDKNYAVGITMGFAFGMTLFALMTLLPMMLQGLLGYPVMETGLLMMPRGIGTLIAMGLVGRLVGRTDPRILMMTAFLLTAGSLWYMTGFSLDIGAKEIAISGFLQGVGMGILFPPMSTLAYATLAPKLRTDAAAFFSLSRNIGSSIGISVVMALLAKNTQVNHAILSEKITPFSRPLMELAPNAPWSIDGAGGLAALNGEVTRQAMMIAYLNDFTLMTYATLATIPLLLLFRGVKAAQGGPGQALVAEH